jgi:hypothetical protein
MPDCCDKPRSRETCWTAYSSPLEKRIHYVQVERNICRCKRTWYLRIGVSKFPLSRARSEKKARETADLVMGVMGLKRDCEWVVTKRKED